LLYKEPLRVRISQRIDRRWILESLLILLGIAILPVILGILVDRRLHSSPVLTMCLMFLGLNVGIVAVYRRIAILYLQIAPLEPVAQPTDPVGDAPLAPQPVVDAGEGNPKHFGGDSC